MKNITCNGIYNQAFMYSLNFILIGYGYDNNGESYYSLSISIHKNYTYIFALEQYLYKDLQDLKDDLNTIYEVISYIAMDKDTVKNLKSDYKKALEFCLIK